MKINPNLKQAIRDYSDLLGKGYPQKRTLELVADRYQLDQNSRGVLFRGVCLVVVGDQRSSKIIESLSDVVALLKIDAFNQFYTIASYLEGKLVYKGNDGILRDASEIHGKGVPQHLLLQSINLVFAYLHSCPQIVPAFYLDQQLGDADFIEDNLRSVFIRREYSIHKSEKVDQLLSDPGDFLLSTSDSNIIDRTNNRVFDLAHTILKLNFSADIPEICSILSEKV